MYYRVAIQASTPPTWQWRSTVLSSLGALLQWLQVYRSFPHDRLRIFSSCSREELGAQLVQENQGLESTSVLATQFLQERLIRSSEAAQGTADRGTLRDQETAPIAVSATTRLSESSRAGNGPLGRGMSALERRRLELELGTGGDHDVPYTFVLPPSMPQVLAWMRLLARVQRGELQA